ncbi:hypothetical protein SCA03_27020 [Streptomyces cacaoi]|uniref:Uncharacterized protein n=1 Tax=Streptomyces cacaoi TaxID=1898 RepID=A0A4Y3QY38_STRCI|nr:hypothetical protein SCA03_27020 [Streptomyces cacaoi]
MKVELSASVCCSWEAVRMRAENAVASGVAVGRGEVEVKAGSQV